MAAVRGRVVVGLALTPNELHLTGQPVNRLAAQSFFYRHAARKQKVMVFMAKPLSDDDINNLAAWFSSIRIDAQAPP